MKTKDERIAEIQRRLAKVNKLLKTRDTRVSLLPVGRHSFRVELAEFKKDEKRGYNYLYVQLSCGDTKTSDRFPNTEDMVWKLGEFLDSISCTVDDLLDERTLKGKTGELIAEKIASGRTVYKYVRAAV
jgi:hypothetical protein